MKGKPPGIFDRILLLINAITSVCLLFSYLAGMVNPRTFWPLAFFGLAYPYLLALTFIFFCYWLFKRPTFAILQVVIILLGWKNLNNTIGFRASTGKDAPKVDSSYLRLMTYNVHGFRVYGESTDDRIKHQMLELIKKENPDVICFQEFYTRKKGAYAIKDSITKMVKMPYSYFLPTMQNDYESWGLAIFSKYPIKGTGNIVFSDKNNGNQSIYADLDIKGKPFRMYNVHLQSISFDKQDYLYVENITEKMQTDIKSSKRIVGMLREAFRKRSLQVDLMKKHMASCQTSFALAGDFNDTPSSYAFKSMSADLKNGFHEKGSGFCITYNGKFPNFQIDYILSTKDIDFINHRVIKAKLSDHYPVRCDVKFKSPQ